MKVRKQERMPRGAPLSPRGFIEVSLPHVCGFAKKRNTAKAPCPPALYPSSRIPHFNYLSPSLRWMIRTRPGGRLRRVVVPHLLATLVGLRTRPRTTLTTNRSVLFTSTFHRMHDIQRVAGIPTWISLIHRPETRKRRRRRPKGQRIGAEGPACTRSLRKASFSHGG